MVWESIYCVHIFAIKSTASNLTINSFEHGFSSAVSKWFSVVDNKEHNAQSRAYSVLEKAFASCP